MFNDKLNSSTIDRLTVPDIYIYIYSNRTRWYHIYSRKYWKHLFRFTLFASDDVYSNIYTSSIVWLSLLSAHTYLFLLYTYTLDIWHRQRTLYLWYTAAAATSETFCAFIVIMYYYYARLKSLYFSRCIYM